MRVDNLLHGDFGRCYLPGKAVIDGIGARLFATLLLAGAALVLASAAGVPLGVLPAVRQNAACDRLVTLAVLVGIATSSFWLGMLFIHCYGVRLAWLPVGRDLHDDVEERPVESRFAGALDAAGGQRQDLVGQHRDRNGQ